MIGMLQAGSSGFEEDGKGICSTLPFAKRNAIKHKGHEGH
jgi:hypothetical protein